jgi:murein lipoprotein
MKRAGFGLMTVGLAAALLLGGCATTKDLDAVKAETQKASAAAASAQSTADQALREAQAARAAAERAEKAAMDAKAASEATNAKIDNMFKKSMQKG